MSNKMSDKILLCPFCPNGIAEKERIFMIGWAIKCKSCGASSPVKDRLEDAIAAWNTRKSLERIVERLEGYKNEYLEREQDAKDAGLNRHADLNGIKAYMMDAIIEIVKEEMEG